MRVLVTGACGFIGGNLSLRLVRDGHTVYGWDNLSSSRPKHWPYGVRMISKKSWESMPYEPKNVPKVDAMFHLAMASSSPMYRANPHIMEETLRTTLQVVEKAKRDGCPVVYASSSSLYNGNLVLPYHEWMDIYVTDYYTEMRYFVERLFHLYSELHNVSSVGLRLFSVFGPRDENKGKYANTLTQFALDMMKGKRPQVYGDGQQSRDFIHVDYVVKAFLAAYEYIKDRDDYEAINVGTGVETTFNEIIAFINGALGTRIKPEYVRNPINNYVQRTCANTNKMSEKLGLDVSNDLVKLIEKHIEYLKKREG